MKPWSLWSFSAALALYSLKSPRHCVFLLLHLLSASAGLPHVLRLSSIFIGFQDQNRPQTCASSSVGVTNHTHPRAPLPLLFTLCWVFSQSHCVPAHCSLCLPSRRVNLSTTQPRHAWDCTSLTIFIGASEDDPGSWLSVLYTFGFLSLTSCQRVISSSRSRRDVLSATLLKGCIVWRTENWMTVLSRSLNAEMFSSVLPSQCRSTSLSQQQ